MNEQIKVEEINENTEVIETEVKTEETKPEGKVSKAIGKAKECGGAILNRAKGPVKTIVKVAVIGGVGFALGKLARGKGSEDDFEETYEDADFSQADVNDSDLED